jgi:hypothetical protein
MPALKVDSWLAKGYLAYSLWRVFQAAQAKSATELVPFITVPSIHLRGSIT